MNKVSFATVFSILFSAIFFQCCTNIDLSDMKNPFPAPSELRAEKLSVNTVQLTWKDNSKGEDGFTIERLSTNSSKVVKATVGANIAQWVDESLQEGIYRYKVYAFYKQRTSDTIAIFYQHVPVETPSNFKLVENAEKIELNWNPISSLIDGFKIDKKDEKGIYQPWKTLDKNQKSTIDNAPSIGTNAYKLYAYLGESLSAGVENSIQILKEPSVTISSPIVSYLKISAYFNLISDGGEICTAGICWSKNQNPTINDFKNSWPQKVKTGESFFGNATNLDENSSYYFRAFATNSKGTTYSSEIQSSLSAQLAPISLVWNEMSAINTDLPSEIKVFSTTSTLNGRAFKAWYAIADLSTGKIELKSTFSTTAKKPSQYIASATDETTYIMTNGGYFGYNGANALSYSLVIDRGLKKADNIGILTRGSYSYEVTRGAFGVTQNQTPMIKWVSGDNGYDLPIPNVEGEVPQNGASSTFPTNATKWNPYTAIGGAPVLMKDGKPTFDFSATKSGKYMTNYELLQTDIFAITVRPPRTLIGNTVDNKIVLFICDGRQTFSDGATLVELVQIMKSIGCVNVLNLDGGGSTAMIANGQLLNSPSDGTERAVASVVSFVKKKN